MTENICCPGSQSEGNDEIDIGRLVVTVLEARWLILGVTSMSVALALIYVVFATPVYKADALIQIEQNVGHSLINDISSALSGKPPASAAQIQLLQSRLILGKTVSDLNLDIDVTKKTFWLIGRGWDRLRGRQNDTVKVNAFNLPDGMRQDSFTLEVLNAQQYQLTSDKGFSAKGEVGQMLNKNGVTLAVSGIQARPGERFSVIKYSTFRMINQLLNNLTVVEIGKDTGMLNLSYTGQDKERIRIILNSITRNYLHQNIQRKSEEATKSLKFLAERLPVVRNQLSIAENRLNAYRQQQDSIDLSLEAKSVLDTIVNIDARLNELAFKEAEISKLYTEVHPAYRTLVEKRKTLENERRRLTMRVVAMPKTQQEIVRLTREVESFQQLYMQLLNKQQQLKISEASTVAGVHIVDAAITQPDKVKPQRVLIILGSILSGLILSVAGTLLRRLPDRGIENPIVLEEAGLNVYACIPLSEWQRSCDRANARNIKGAERSEQIRLLAVDNPTDPAIEAIRSLRAGLYFTMTQAVNNVLMLTGIGPSIGKTFVCANLAVVVSHTSKRVLVIDCDMRKGYIHEMMGTSNLNGLSDMLFSESADFSSYVHKTSIPNLDFIPRGPVPKNPSELLLSECFAQLMKWASEHYDMVLIDTPPIMAVSDAAIVGHHAGTSLVVVRYAVNTLKEVKVSINLFKQNGINVSGIILNSVFRRATGYQDYSYYEYKSNME